MSKAYRVSQENFENAITPSFMEETFSKFSVIVAVDYPFAAMMFYYQVALLQSKGVSFCSDHPNFGKILWKINE